MLDYFPERVRVMDLIYERDGASNWGQKIIAYDKLRLSETLMAEKLTQMDWQQRHQEYQQYIVYQLAMCAQ